MPEDPGTPAVPQFPTWRRRLAVFAPPIVVVLFVLVLFGSMEVRRESTARAQATSARITDLHQLRTRLVDAETGQRGYLITGDRRYLEPFYDAERDVHGLLDGLIRAHAANPRRLAALRQLDSLVDRRFAIMALPIVARDSAGLDAAREQLIAGRGIEHMARLRAQIGFIEQVERTQLEAEHAAQERAGLLVLLVLLGGAPVVVATALLTNWQFRRYANSLERLNAAGREANERLQEQAVELEMQTAELQAMNDELTEQQAQLEAMAAELEATNEELQVTNLELEDRTDAAEAANRAKAQFLASMSHELRTPLNAIGGYVDLLELGVHGSLTDEQRADLERIRHNSRHLLVLISDILSFAKVQSGRIELQTSDVWLPELLGQMESVVRPMVDGRRITFLAEQPPAVFVRGDRDRIRQVLLNLLSNAVKFTTSGGAIFLRAQQEAGEVRIQVGDSGIGIPAELQETIFQPFVQVPQPGGALNDGVGLGLSISRELAQAMGGTLTVESTPGTGSVFTLSLPQGKATPKHAVTPPLSVEQF
jgi:signal transduction histidine kinase